jgi:hypothetical protein
MKSLLVLVLAWLLYQYGAMLWTKGAHHPAPRERAVQAVMNRLSPDDRQVVRTLIDRYGPPDARREGVLSWNHGSVVVLVRRPTRD